MQTLAIWAKGVRSLWSCRWTSHKIPEVSWSGFVGALSILLSPGQLVAAKTAELFRERDLRRVRSASREKNSGHSCRVAMEGCHKDMAQVGFGHKNIHLESKRCRRDECLLCFPKRCGLDSELQKQLQYLDFLNILGYYPVCSLQLHQLVLSSHENIYFRWHTAHQIAWTFEC